ncbi:hypothetical protein KC887_01440 [Candidatus Kaiserbacteria bacterium]|nr:hypothetical protein [Candidatus Kaiserbacteria bacterium]
MTKPGPQKQYSETLYARLEPEQKAFLLSIGDDYSDGLRRLIDYCRENVPVGLIAPKPGPRSASDTPPQSD